MTNENQQPEQQEQVVPNSNELHSGINIDPTAVTLHEPAYQQQTPEQK